MAYDTDHLTKLEGLKALAERLKSELEEQGSEIEEIQQKIDNITAEGGEPNVIETIKVNGTALEVENKTVDITVPTAVSELENDSGYQTEEDVQTAIDEAITEDALAHMQVADEVPTAEEAEPNVLYLVKNEETGYYDVYALIGDEVVQLDDTSIDLSNYLTKDDVATDEEVEEMLDEVFGTDDGAGEGGSTEP